MVDMFLVLVLATAGDELQGIKRGIMELADLVVVNKDDGDNAGYTKQALASYTQALHLFPPKENGWTVPVQSCSALENRRVDKVWQSIERYFKEASDKDLKERRAEQNRFWLRQAIEEELLQRFFNDENMTARISDSEDAVKKGKISPFKAARDLLNAWHQSS
jgi:LAO/AO transport system kinase